MIKISIITGHLFTLHNIFNYLTIINLPREHKHLFKSRYLHLSDLFYRRILV